MLFVVPYFTLFDLGSFNRISINTLSWRKFTIINFCDEFVFNYDTEAVQSGMSCPAKTN